MIDATVMHHDLAKLMWLLLLLLYRVRAGL